MAESDKTAQAVTEARAPRGARLPPPGLGWAKYVWLSYLIFYFSALVFSHASLGAWLLSLLAVCAFVPLYLSGFRAAGRGRLAIAWAIYALGALMMPVNSGANCFFVYAVAFVPFIGRPRVVLRWLAIMLGGLALQAWLWSWPAGVWAPTVLICSVVGLTNIVFAQKRRHAEQLALAHDAVEEMARIAERERIGRDLHDLLGHTLSLIVLKSELASKLADRDTARAIEEIRDVERISREALAEVRKAVRGYRPEGFEHEVKSAERALRSAGVRPALSITPLPLSPDEDRTLAYALREAVTNVVRHAGAQSCSIALRAGDGGVTLEIQDDGCGGTAPEGTGLSGMRARLRELGGSLERDGRAGTRLRLNLPRVSAPAEDGA